MKFITLAKDITGYSAWYIDLRSITAVRKSQERLILYCKNVYNVIEIGYPTNKLQQLEKEYEELMLQLGKYKGED